jgi:hypothetical protein
MSIEKLDRYGGTGRGVYFNQENDQVPERPNQILSAKAPPRTNGTSHPANGQNVKFLWMAVIPRFTDRSTCTRNIKHDFIQNR